jgi:hypothetical protein
LPGELRVGACLPADHEEGCLHAFVRERPEHLVGVGRDRPIVERQHHLAGSQRQREAVIVAADQRHGARVDGQDAADAKRMGIVAGRRLRGCTAECSGTGNQCDKTQAP